MDVREYIKDGEETLRAVFAGLMKSVWTSMPASVTADSQDGHTAVAQPTVKRQVTNPDGSVTYEDHPEHPDLPIHHLGGGPVVTTHPTKSGDTGLILYASRMIDSWFQSGGSQQPMEDRSHHLGDGVFLSGIRATPDKLAQVSQTSTQTRTVDKRSVVDHGPDGTKIKSVDPSTAPASQDFDPFKDATKHYEHSVSPTDGHRTAATDGDTVHEHSTTHDAGFKASANNGAHSISAHPSDGIAVKSSTAHTIAAPNATLDKSGNLMAMGNIAAPSGMVSGASGQFPAGFLGNLVLSALGLGGPPSSNGSVSIGANAIAAPTLQTNAVFTVAELMADYPPAPALLGMRAVVTDAALPQPTGSNTSDGQTSAPAPMIAFLSVLVGGGTIKCPAWCDGTNWLAT